MSLFARSAVLCAAALILLSAGVHAVPEASHVRLECEVLRLNVNNFATRHQITLTVTVSAPEDDALNGVEDGELTLSNPVGDDVVLSLSKMAKSPKRFKAANAKLLFKAVSDPGDPATTNVPEGFFEHDGQYGLQLSLQGETYTGKVEFGRRVGMSVLQAGSPAANFTLRSEAPFEIYTAPAEFGPVYYKRQDITNFMFQLANMNQAIESGDYHNPVESPLYVFQIGVSDGEGGPTTLFDPAEYIEGYQRHLIRSESTSTPLRFDPGLFGIGDVVVVDFMRQDSVEPDTVFFSSNPDFTDQVVVSDRVIYALEVMDPPVRMGTW